MNGLEKARHFRNLADEVRAKAALLKNPETREVLARLALDYDNLAESIEQTSKLPVRSH